MPPTKKPSVKKAAPKRAARGADDGRVEVLNPNHPDHRTRVDAALYAEMKRALLKCLPKKAPGLTQTEMRDAVLPHLSEELFPGGAKSGWWSKCVQLDLEARGEVVREKTERPLRWHRAK